MRIQSLDGAMVLAFGISSIALSCGRSGFLDDLVSTNEGDASNGMVGADSSNGMAGSNGMLGADASGTMGYNDAGESLDATTLSDGTSKEATASDAQPGQCNSFTCANGCCLPDGTCFVAGPADDPGDTPCGSNGEACATCPSGDTCFAGGCMHKTVGSCSPSNCNGCCFPGGMSGGSTSCYQGSQDEYCGSGGGQCQLCAPSVNGGHCVADPGGGGHCEGIGTCDATNCAGCCVGDLCAMGTQNVGCGTGGAACQDCAADGGICIPEDKADGGVVRLCGYQCLSTIVPECQIYCSAVDDCFDSSQVQQHL